MKKRILIIMIFFIVLLFGTGITYSYFISNGILNSTPKSIAKFIFNAVELDELNLPLADLKPGDSSDYLFSVSNTYDGEVSNVTIGYRLSIKTYHLVPLEIKLYNNDNNEELLDCRENVYSRNVYNELVCTTSDIVMSHVDSILDNYKLTINFPNNFNDQKYAGLVDYIKIEINSWQRIEEQS